jgi:hypothetical protein
MFRVFLTSILSTLKHKDMCMNVLETKVEVLNIVPTSLIYIMLPIWKHSKFDFLF